MSDLGLTQILELARSSRWLHAAVVGVLGILLAVWIPRRLTSKSLHPQASLAIKMITRYALLSITGIWVLRILGIDLSVLLGAAGILTVAIGFASQTSASNLISGLFLMVERPFVVGDLIKVAELTGTVISVDPLSVKLRTFDNLLVRIPNETVLKSNVTNLTHYPVRRYDLKLKVGVEEDLGVVRSILNEVAVLNPICLEEPAPSILYLGYGESCIEVQFSAWSTSENFLQLKRELFEQVQVALNKKGVLHPHPQRRVHMVEANAKA